MVAALWTPVTHYTDKNRIFRSSAAALPEEQLHGEKARSQFGRALHELGIEWIAAHSPQAKGRIERLFETLQDRLVKEMRLAGIDSIAAANHFLETRFLPQWEERFTAPSPSLEEKTMEADISIWQKPDISTLR
jgi:hypothetical protein